MRLQVSCNTTPSMEKQWKELGERQFAFLVNGEEIGTYYRGMTG
jgi:hypothetical protein